MSHTLFLKVGNRVRPVGSGTPEQMKVTKDMLVESGVMPENIGIWRSLVGTRFAGLMLIIN